MAKRSLGICSSHDRTQPEPLDALTDARRSLCDRGRADLADRGDDLGSVRTRQQASNAALVEQSAAAAASMSQQARVLAESVALFKIA